MTFMAIALFMNRFPANWPNVVLVVFITIICRKERCRVDEESVEEEVVVHDLSMFCRCYEEGTYRV